MTIKPHHCSHKENVSAFRMLGFISVHFTDQPKTLTLEVNTSKLWVAKLCWSTMAAIKRNGQCQPVFVFLPWTLQIILHFRIRKSSIKSNKAQIRKLNALRSIISKDNEQNKKENRKKKSQKKQEGEGFKTYLNFLFADSKRKLKMLMLLKWPLVTSDKKEQNLC